MANLTLSKESKQFIDNLRIYLFSSGKKTKEVEDITQELEIHLFEAEKQNKGIEHIIGNSPKAYMEQLSNEMSFDIKGWAKFVPLIILGAFSGLVLKDALLGTIEYTFLELIGNPLICVTLLVVYMFVFRMISSQTLTKVKEFSLLYLTSFLSIGLFIGLLILNRYVETPIVTLSATGNVLVACLAVAFLIGISIWSKTLISIVLPIFYIVPDYLVRFTTFSEANQLILSTIMMYAGIGLYLLFTFKKSSDKA
ncbi:HAAS domain-containing protein [Sutcliffiella deserti]|uniref:HAAS domain-containing protein n=1 Tax=Sutcliffiella deserti TaxID=2875501 RepID=UPI001CBADC9D|nr:hypothetical protein [Sutcliffiella deserti]